MYSDDIEEAADTLLEAERIKKDPALMAAVKKCLDDRKKDIGSIQDLKDKYAKMNEDEKEDKEGSVEGVEDGLETEEDKASQQKIDFYDKKSKEMMGGASEESKVGGQKKKD